MCSSVRSNFDNHSLSDTTIPSILDITNNLIANYQDLSTAVRKGIGT